MQKFLISYLIVTGIGAFIAIAAPGLVVIGLFLLVLPGLILGAMPTAFLWGLLFAVGWFVARGAFGDGVIPVLAGLAVLAAVITTVPFPTRQADLARYDASILPDVIAPDPIALRGDVRLSVANPRLNKSSTPGYRYQPGEAGYRCDAFCLGLLFTPGVTSVTIDKVSGLGEQPLSVEARTYRLVRRPCRTGVAIDVAEMQPPLPAGNKPGLRSYEDGKALIAEWTLKLATEVCVVMEPALQRADIAIAEWSTSERGKGGWSFGPGSIHTQTVELRRGDRVIHREHQSSLTTLDRIWAITATGGIENFRFGWSWQTINSKRGYGSVDLARTMAERTDMAGRAAPGASQAESRAALAPALRARLEAALDDPAEPQGGPGFQVMRGYFEAVGDAAREEDVALVERLVADERLTKFDGMYALKLGPVQARRAYDAWTRRLLRTGDVLPLAKSGAGSLVPKDGPEAAVLIGPSQRILLADPQRRLAAPELARALGWDRSETGWQLFGILKHHAAILAEIHRQRSAREIGSYDRQQERDANIDLLGAARAGLCLRAPQDPKLLAELDAFLISGVMPRHLVDGNAMTEWNVVLARMGKPIDTIDKPASMSGTVENYRRNLRAKVERFRPDRC